MQNPELSRRKISPSALRKLGWSPAGYRSYVHRDGWYIQHCGHPTALWPYLLYAPDGRPIMTGAAFGKPADHGKAWPTVAAAADYVFTQTRSFAR